MILNNCRIRYLTENNLNTEYQIGFQSDCRTSDHIFTLRTIVDRYTQNKKKLYVCFIDFKEAFDSVWREGLIYKLLKQEVGGPFGIIIQNMYADSKVAIKLADGITPAFK